jgi:chromosome segregation ATPase
MAEPGEQQRFEREMEDLKASIEKYLTREGQLPSQVVGDLTKAIQDLSDHLVNLHRRIEKIEDTHDEWTTRGWMPPPGSDRPS